jgi:uncharacterized protein (TIGR02266 family)
MELWIGRNFMGQTIRDFERLDHKIAITSDSEDNFYTGFSENISEGGVFISTHMLQPIGSEVEFTMTLTPGIKKVKVRGIVRWVREVEESAGVTCGMGVQFVGMSEAVEERIQGFLSQIRDPLFFDSE